MITITKDFLENEVVSVRPPQRVCGFLEAELIEAQSTYRCITDVQRHVCTVHIVHSTLLLPTNDQLHDISNYLFHN